MEEHNKTRKMTWKSYLPMIPGFVSTMAIIGVFTYAGMSKERKIKENLTIPENNQVMTYDVNKDGLEDVVSKDGSVEIGQEDGTYLSLRTVMESHAKRVVESYHLKKSEDGRYYTKSALESKNNHNIQTKQKKIKGGN